MTTQARHMSVSELARTIANYFPAEATESRYAIRSFADGLFLELPEDRHCLLGQLATIINEIAESADTTKEHWQTIKRIWKAATEPTWRATANEDAGARVHRI